ncbi:GAF domain-containing protein [Chitinimonas arctica]|uniref:GAF domain-containing protein n=1 Tax=Chitinimonas arctica TaxID=2594795 RepID=A0A516SL46_9NEIS|nr:GAF domain-containing protein [Chitinimonas arctica]QDQ28879.1 GAF domain-containing protein [Chitinimonas arctica]
MHDTNLLKNLFGLLGEGKLDRPKFFQMLTRAIVQEMAASRASVWFYDGDLQDRAVCESLYDVSDGHWSNGELLSEDDFADFFAALRDMHKIVADDARQHASTAGFSESYFEPLNIYSQLSVGIEFDTRQIGWVCCENCAEIRNWSQADMQYLQQAAAMISLAFRKFGG